MMVFAKTKTRVALKNIIIDFCPFFEFLLMVIIATSLYALGMVIGGVACLAMGEVEAGMEELALRITLGLHAVSVICGVLAFFGISKLEKIQNRNKRRKEEASYENPKLERFVKEHFWGLWLPLEAIMQTSAFFGIASFGGFLNSVLNYFINGTSLRVDLLLIMGACIVLGAITWYATKIIDKLYFKRRKNAENVSYE